MIKKYLEFIKESSQDFHSIGEWVESLISDDYIKNIVSRYTESSQDIDLPNSINVLDPRTQREIKSQIDDYLQSGIQEKDPTMIASTEISEGAIAGKGIFSSFLKSLTSLGQKNSQPNWEKCPDDFLWFYYFPNLDAQIVKQVFGRFKSLLTYSHIIDYGKNEVNLYFGVKCNGTFEYGVAYDELTSIGQFKMSQSTIKWIIAMDLSSAASLKKELVNLSYPDIITLGKIKNDIKSFNPGHHEKKSSITIKDKIISFGYFGGGTWNNGKLDEVEFLTTKNNFINWVMGKKWGSKVLVSVKPESFWLNIHIKLK